MTTLQIKFFAPAFFTPWYCLLLTSLSRAVIGEKFTNIYFYCWTLFILRLHNTQTPSLTSTKNYGNTMKNKVKSKESSFIRILKCGHCRPTCSIKQLFWFIRWTDSSQKEENRKLIVNGRANLWMFVNTFGIQTDNCLCKPITNWKAELLMLPWCIVRPHAWRTLFACLSGKQNFTDCYKSISSAQREKTEFQRLLSLHFSCILITSAPRVVCVPTMRVYTILFFFFYIKLFCINVSWPLYTSIYKTLHSSRNSGHSVLQHTCYGGSYHISSI